MLIKDDFFENYRWKNLWEFVTCIECKSEFSVIIANHCDNYKFLMHDSSKIVIWWKYQKFTFKDWVNQESNNGWPIRIDQLTIIGELTKTSSVRSEDDTVKGKRSGTKTTIHLVVMVWCVVMCEWMNDALHIRNNNSLKIKFSTFCFLEIFCHVYLCWDSYIL